MITRRSTRLAIKAEKRNEINDQVKPQNHEVESSTQTKVKREQPPTTTRRPPSRPTRKQPPALKRKQPPSRQAVRQKKPKYPSLNFDTGYISDPIVDSLRKANLDNSQGDKRTLDSQVLDQICLEGLSGVTFRRLLVLLDAIFPNLKCLHSEQVQDYVWKIIVMGYLNQPENAMLNAYYFDVNRKSKTEKTDDEDDEHSQIIFDRPIRLPKKTSERLQNEGDMFLYPVQDGRIKGSCENYKEREDVTSDLIDMIEGVEARECLDAVNEKYGIDSIVFVASQNLRFQAIVPNYVDPNIDIKLREYCTLELIARSRTLGLVFPNDKQFGRYRILLIAKALISQYQETISAFVIQHIIRFSPGKNPDGFKSLIPKPKVKLVQEQEMDEFETPECVMKKICCNPNRLKLDKDFMKMIYDFIALSENGCTQIDIRRKFRLPKFHVRNHLKNMISLAWICSKTDVSSDRPLRIYKTVHKSFRRKMLLKDKIVKPSRGVMASWDEKDLKAKKILGHKRSSFTQAEDSFLILCRIASLLLEPKLRKLSYCVNKRVIRDLMHEELIESQNKTSDSCLRRMKYLRRLPSNIMSVDELTAELRDDTDIRKIVDAKKISTNEAKLNKLFIHLLRAIRIKIPLLLGLDGTSGVSSLSSGLLDARLRRKKDRLSITLDADGLGPSDETGSYEQLRRAYDIVDCHSVTSIQSRASTYEDAKNVADMRLNNVALVTMAYALTNSLGSKRVAITTGDIDRSKDTDDRCAPLDTATLSSDLPADKKRRFLDKRSQQRLLGEFYSNYPDKLVSSVQSRLNKRSLLVRKFTDTDNGTNSPEQSGAMHMARSSCKTSLKLNQSVLFLLNRYQSSSLMQLAYPINAKDPINLSESNEMSSIALLTSLCAFSSFDFDLELKIPINVVGLENQQRSASDAACTDPSVSAADDKTRQSMLTDSLVVQPCSVGFQCYPMKQQADAIKATDARENPLKAFLDEAENSIRVISSREEAADCNATQVSVEDGCEKTAADCSTAAATTTTTTRSMRRTRSQQVIASSNCAAIRSKRSDQQQQQQQTSNSSTTEARVAVDRGAQTATTAGAANTGGFGSSQKWLVRGYRTSVDDESGFEIEGERRTRSKSKKKKPSSQASVSTGDDEDDADGEDATRESDADQLRNRTRTEPSEGNQVAIEYSARLWKTVDGRIHIETLSKLIEALLSWIIMFPGIELALILNEFGHLMPMEHLLELLDLMKDLNLISATTTPSLSSDDAASTATRPCLFGSCRRRVCSTTMTTTKKTTTYEPMAGAFIRYCQLLDSLQARLSAHQSD